MHTRRLTVFFTDALMYGLLIAVSAFMILPFIWMVSTSLKPADEIFAIPPIIISPNSSLNAYIYLQEQYNILGIVWNTFFIAFSATILAMVTVFFTPRRELTEQRAEHSPVSAD